MALQDGLLGFRGIPASILGVAEAMAKAYPLLVGPALERAKATSEPGQQQPLEDAWLREVCGMLLHLATEGGFGKRRFILSILRCMASASWSAFQAQAG